MRTRLYDLGRRLWSDETGGINSAELMLIMTILCVGMLVGIKSMRDATVTEFADMAQALSDLNQSYSFPGIVAAPGSGDPSRAPSSFVDEPDFCDTPVDVDIAFPPGSKCVNVCVAASGE